MIKASRIGSLDIAKAIADRIGSYVDMYSIEFLAVHGDLVQCWYQHPDDDGPVFAIELSRNGSEWSLQLTEHPPGTEQDAEVQ